MIWIWIRRMIQALAFLFFIACFIGTQTDGWPPAVTSLPFRLDPLLDLVNILSSRAFLIGSALGLTTIFLTILFGRAWCGWLCPLGSLLDVFRFRQSPKRTRTIPEGWRRAKYVVLVGILTAALMSNASLLVLDPMTILYRGLTVSVWPVLEYLLTVVETALYPIAFLQDAIIDLDSALRPFFFPAQPISYYSGFLVGLILLVIFSLNLVAHRFWCRYLCPLGGMLAWISKIALFRRRLGEPCSKCGLCEKSCPTGTIRADRMYASDPSECTLCLNCRQDCAKSAVRFAFAAPQIERRPYDPDRRLVLTTAAFSVASIFFARRDARTTQPSQTRIQPPGAGNRDLITKCIRCGECLRACPTHGLQPAGLESGLEGIWTPILIPRLGYCDYGCATCGIVCPVEAIPPLSLEQKRQQVIGKAYIDKNRCLPWADGIPCIICEEMCPLPEKAVKLDVTSTENPDGTTSTLQLPVVDRDRCIGCGICEFKCPLVGQAAIRIYTI